MDRADFRLPPLAATADWLLLGAVLSLSMGYYGFRLLSAPGTGELTTVVRAGDELVAELPLDKDTVLVVRGQLGELRVVQKSGEIWFEDAPCKLKICERMGHIHRSGEMVVCAPNKVMARVERRGGGDDLKEGLDAVSR